MRATLGTISRKLSNINFVRHIFSTHVHGIEDCVESKGISRCYFGTSRIAWGSPDAISYSLGTMLGIRGSLDVFVMH